MECPLVLNKSVYCTQWKDVMIHNIPNFLVEELAKATNILSTGTAPINGFVFVNTQLTFRCSCQIAIVMLHQSIIHFH